MESHLFGHVRGSFTGAVENRDGVFSLAHTGTLFIDEISELSLPLQAKLLRVIQMREFVKVGGSKSVRTDIRLITASNKDLRRAVADGTFREDLYYRIAVVMLQTPPLRERKGDIALLVDHFLRKFSAAHRKRIRAVTPAAMELLMSYQWPGNIRQLENCIEQAVVLCEGDLVDVGALWLGDTAAPRPTDSSIRIRSGLTLARRGAAVHPAHAPGDRRQPDSRRPGPRHQPPVPAIQAEGLRGGRHRGSRPTQSGQRARAPARSLIHAQP